MRRAITIALGCTVAVLLSASVAVAGNGNGNGNGGKALAAKACAAEKKGLKSELGNKEGKATFRTLHAKHAMRNCIKETTAEVEVEKTNAAQECLAARNDDFEAFVEEWGSNDPKGEKSKGSGKNAMGKCVSSTVRGEIQDGVEDTVNAARECRDARAVHPKGFARSRFDRRSGARAGPAVFV